MIAALTGVVRDNTTQLVVDVNGVGYGVSVANVLLSQYPVGTPVDLYIYTHVAEQSLELFGFSTQKEKELFLLMLQVSGVGPRTALQLAALGSTQITNAVQQGQTSIFTQVPRVGKKLAQKIIIELSGKLGSLKELQLGSLDDTQSMVLDALRSLGYDEALAHDLVSKEDYSNMEIEIALAQTIKKLRKR